MSIVTVERGTLDETLEQTGADRLIRFLGKQSAWSETHSRRTALLGFGLARLIGLPPELALEIGFAGGTHDLGKSGEAYQPVLASDHSPLTAAERQIMGRHPHDGAAIIRSELITPGNAEFHPLLQRAAGVALMHHDDAAALEAVYPGADGEVDRHVVRTVMLADQMEALTSPVRPHGLKLANPYEAAGMVITQLRDAGHDAIFDQSLENAALRMATMLEAERAAA